jgi:hypothetical protein
VHLHTGERQAGVRWVQLLRGRRPGRAQRGRQALHPQRRAPHRHGPGVRRQVLLRLALPVRLQARVVIHCLLLINSSRPALAVALPYSRSFPRRFDVSNNILTVNNSSGETIFIDICDQICMNG